MVLRTREVMEALSVAVSRGREREERGDSGEEGGEVGHTRLARAREEGTEGDRMSAIAR